MHRPCHGLGYGISTDGAVIRIPTERQPRRPKLASGHYAAEGTANGHHVGHCRAWQSLLVD